MFSVKIGNKFRIDFRLKDDCMTTLSICITNKNENVHV